MGEIGLYEAMRTTRAVRRLRPDPIPDAVLARVLEAATWAPSGGNRQPWRIVVVRDAGTKAALQRMYEEGWRAYLPDARQEPAPRAHGEAAALTAAQQAKRERALRAASHLARNFHRAPVILVMCFDPNALVITDRDLGRPSVVGGASIYPAVQNLLLACRAEGLGCVLTTLLCAREAEIRPLLRLPEPWAFAAFVPVGFPVGTGHGPLGRRPIREMVFADRWGEPFVTPPADDDA